MFFLTNFYLKEKTRIGLPLLTNKIRLFAFFLRRCSCATPHRLKELKSNKTTNYFITSKMQQDGKLLHLRSLLQKETPTTLTCSRCSRHGLYYDSSLDLIPRMWFSQDGRFLSLENIDEGIKNWESKTLPPDSEPWKVIARAKCLKDCYLAMFQSFKKLLLRSDLGTVFPTSPRILWAKQYEKELKRNLQPVLSFILPLTDLVISYFGFAEPFYLHVIEESIPLPFNFAPDDSVDEYMKREWCIFLNDPSFSRLKDTPEMKALRKNILSQYYLPQRWNPFPDTPRIGYTFKCLDLRMEHELPQLGFHYGTWCKSKRTFHRTRILCRDCIFQMTRPTKEICPWLFDDDLFPQKNENEFEELCATYLREDTTKRRDVSLALRE
jgi:hypothetical protein